ncbi:MAG: hypothetical protein R3C49_19305 [Planctomycetaceae bacterium]
MHCLVRRNWFSAMLVLIGCISLYDAFLVVLFKDTIQQLERNPIGQWLIEIANGDVTVFVRAKLAGTLLVLSVLVAMRRCRSRSTMPVTNSIAACQTGLLGYLTLA